MADLDTFRAETRAWLEANCPAEMRDADARRKRTPAGAGGTSSSSRRRRSNGSTPWRRAAGPCPTGRRNMAAAGCRRPRPRSSRRKWRAIGAAPPLTSFGISMLGPALLKYGNEEQKKRFLTEIARGEIRWCQGYSEPGAGSRPRRAADQGRGQGRPLAGQRPEGVDQLCRPGRLDLLPGPHLERVQAWRDQLPAVRHGKPGRLDQADPADQRQFALLRDLLRRCEGAQGPAGRRGQQGLGRRQISARPRARDDQRHGAWRRERQALGESLGGRSTIRCCAPKSPRSTSTRSPSRR